MIQPLDFYLNPNDSSEVFLFITDIVIPNIRPYYLISNKGNVYSDYSHRMMKPTISFDGYKVCTIRNINNIGITAYIHRMEMMVFNYIPGCENLAIDHIDCNKLNNNIENLEWVTLSENTKRAAANGLLLSGEDAPWTKVTNEQVHKICQLFISNVGISEISRIVGCGIDSVFRVVHGIGRRDISSLYDIESVYRNILSDSKIHLICKTISEFKDLNFSEIKMIIQDRLGIRINRKIDSIIRALYRKDIYCYYRISSLYEY